MAKPKSIHNIEQRMEGLEPASFRYKVLDSARSFKGSWIELGQYLFTVYKDKLYKDWGYITFEAYCAKEIGIRQNTAIKMLKSYSFLEKEEPSFLKPEALEERKPHQIPTVDSVNALRLAKQSERIPDDEYEALRDEVLDENKEEAEVKKKIKYILKTHAPKPTAEDAEEKKSQVMKRFVQSLQSTRNEMSQLGVPNKIIKKIEELIELIQL